MANPIPTVLEARGITDVANIFWQGGKDMELSKVFATASNYATAAQPIRLRLQFPIDFVATRIRMQVRVAVDMRYQTTTDNNGQPRPVWNNLRFDAGACSAMTSTTVDWFTSANWLGYRFVENLVFSEPAQVYFYNPSNYSYYSGSWPEHRTLWNPVELDFEITERAITRNLWLGMRVWTQTTASSPVTTYPTHRDTALYDGSNYYSSNRVMIEIYSITVDGFIAGCENVTVSSLDRRLISTTDGMAIEYPMLFLSRNPVKEDARGLKEVLVFQDRATTLRVHPQPLILNEENDYRTYATIESNGYWALYDYDRKKLDGSLDSGSSFMDGAGNDLLTLIKHPSWSIYGLYDLVLLFSADGSDEPYVVPVVLDYAKPLSVAAPPQVPEPQTRIVTINFTDNIRNIDLHIFRDREWHIVGFPSDYLTIGRMSGVRDDIVPLALRNDYNLLGVASYTFLVQSGTRRVIVVVNVNITSHFSVAKFDPYPVPVGVLDKAYVVLSHDGVQDYHDGMGVQPTPYAQRFVIRRKGYGTSVGGLFTGDLTQEERGYSVPVNAALRYTFIDSSLTRPAGIADVGEPSGTVYDTLLVEYVGTQTNLEAGRYNISQEFQTTVAAQKITLTVYYNIRLWFEVLEAQPVPLQSGASQIQLPAADCYSPDVYGAGYEAGKAFDGNDSTCWSSGYWNVGSAACWVAINYGQLVTVGAVELVTHSGPPSGMPRRIKGFTLQGSNDGKALSDPDKTWVMLTAVVDYPASGTRKCPVDVQPEAYSAYRIVATDGHASYGYVAIAEVKLYEWVDDGMSWPAPWKASKTINQTSYEVVGALRQRIDVNRTASPSASVARILLCGNRSVNTHVGPVTAINQTEMQLTRMPVSIASAVVLNGAAVDVTANYEHLNIADAMRVTFSAFTWYAERGTAGPGDIVQPAAALMIYYEIRHPHFLWAKRHNNLQWDNDWEQHLWCYTNPDALLSSSFGITELTPRGLAPGDQLKCTYTGINESGYFLLKLQHARIAGPVVDAYKVTATGNVRVFGLEYGDVLSGVMTTGNDVYCGQLTAASTEGVVNSGTRMAWHALYGERAMTGTGDNQGGTSGSISHQYWASAAHYDSSTGNHVDYSDALGVLQTSQWWRLDFQQPTEVSAIRMIYTSATSGRLMAPVDFTIEGADLVDGPYTVLASFNDIVWSTTREWRTFELSETDDYRFYRINITRVSPGATSTAIGEIEFLRNLDMATSLSAPQTSLATDFRVGVHHQEHIRNEIVPLMIDGSTEQDSAERAVSSLFNVTDGWLADAVMSRVFNRRNGEADVTAPFTTSRERMRNLAAYLDRNSTFSFIIEFDQHYVIRSWSYAVLGRANVACGFLIEGQMDGYHSFGEWDMVSAVSDYSTRDADSRSTSINIDYVIVTPRPWKRLRITVTQARNASGDKVTTAWTTTADIRIGQFQFYCGYPMLGRGTSYSTTGTQDIYQRSTRSSDFRLVSGDTGRQFAGVCDGVLPSEITIPNGTNTTTTQDTGIGSTGYYAANPPTHWNYTLALVSPSSVTPQQYSGNEAKFGIVLEGVNAIKRYPRIVGMRYDTSRVLNYTSVGALILGVSEVVRSTPTALSAGENFTSRLAISAWRYLGFGGVDAIGDVNTLAIDTIAAAKLETCALAISKTVFDAHPDVLVHGTTLMQNDTVGRDHRLIRYSGPTIDINPLSQSLPGDWENIGSDIVMRVPTGQPYSLPKTTVALMADDGLLLDGILDEWNSRLTSPITDRVAFTNPADEMRLLLDSGGWRDDLEPFSFAPFRGLQIYRNLDDRDIRSVRLHVPGLADVHNFSNQISDEAGWVRAIVGDVQFFELFRNSSATMIDASGSDVACKSIEVLIGDQWRQIQNGEVLYVSTTATSVNVRCRGLRINGVAWTGSTLPIWAENRSAHATSSVGRTQVTTAGTSVSLEMTYTVTNIVLVCLAGCTPPSTLPGTGTGSTDDAQLRLVPFFTFLVVRT